MDVGWCKKYNTACKFIFCEMRIFVSRPSKCVHHEDKETGVIELTKEEKLMSGKNSYSRGEFGIWEVYGEDPNCDLGGYHSQPLLGHYEGYYGDVLDYAETLDGWTTWGGGGTIKKYIPPKIVIKKVTVNWKEEREKLLQEKAELEQKLKEIDEKL